MKRERLRLFFALWPDPGVRRRIAAMQAGLSWPGRRVEPRLLHLTLAFLGEVAADRLAELTGLAAALAPVTARLELDRAGSFPGARAGWVAPTVVPESLRDLAAALQGALIERGFPCDRRPWHPHVTLYRDLRNPPASMKVEAVEWRVDSFRLMHSRHVDARLEYTPLGIFPGPS